MATDVSSSGATVDDGRIPSVSVILVAYNNRNDLERCLPALEREELDLEIIVIDNSSSDGVDEWLHRHYPRVQIVPLQSNLGFAAAGNRGIHRAQGRYVLILNPDTEVSRGAIQEMLRVAEAYPSAFVSAKLLQPDGSINTCGNVMHYTGITTCLGLGEEADMYQGVIRPPLLSGAAILARREHWLEVGGFDEDFFLYMEDADLSLRVRLNGGDILCAADACITHDYRLNMRPEKLYLLERNRLLTLLKTYEAVTLGRLLPSLILTELATWMYAALKGPHYLVARYQVYRWIVQNRSTWRRSRASVQASRRIPDAALLPALTSVLPFRQLMGSPRVAILLEETAGSVYRWLSPWRPLA